MKRRITDDELRHMRELLEDGASYSEVARSTGRDRASLARRLPGYGWSQSAGGKHGMLIRHNAGALQ